MKKTYFQFRSEITIGDIRYTKIVPRELPHETIVVARLQSSANSKLVISFIRGGHKNACAKPLIDHTTAICMAFAQKGSNRFIREATSRPDAISFFG